jgi:ubiquinone/menaquinone biosynthesis C-methylase UbiE
MTVSSTTVKEDFESQYIRLRQKEGRIYTDSEVVNLPVVHRSHLHYKEWVIRGRSAKRLVNHLRRKKTGLRILEIGCGNGWLSHKLAELPGSNVIGMDINFVEIEQAARVFHAVPNLFFVYGNTAPARLFAEQRFDCIVFASSIQYFPSLTKILYEAGTLLQPTGEIHILDSPFYEPAEVLAAKQRTRQYFEKMGCAFLCEHYFHHSLSELNKKIFEILYQPSDSFRLLSRVRNPFPWIKISANKL